MKNSEQENAKGGNVTFTVHLRFDEGLTMTSKQGKKKFNYDVIISFPEVLFPQEKTTFGTTIVLKDKVRLTRGHLSLS